jgi:protein-L-isoaspartate O-methyltransferase
MTQAEREERAARACDRARALKGVKVEAVSAPYLYPTPPALAARMVELADLDPGNEILEPSAGTGAILDALPDDCHVLAIELDYRLAERLASVYSRPHLSIMQADFLGFDVLTGRGFDRILMNPPFDHGLDIRHIQHAFELLAPGGLLVAICADGGRQRAAFKDAELYESLPPGTFAQAGTMVNAALVVIEKPFSKL